MRKNVLLVEDDQDLAVVVGSVLEGQGYWVNIVGSVKEFRIYTKKRVPDLVIMDVKLPDGRGDKLVRELKLGKGDGVKVILVSGTENLKRIADRVGADGWLSKPFKITELLDLIN